jgi:glycosyltransferase involved in cell wall biosynthesis
LTDRSALRIGIDARELLGHPTGVGRYLGELVRRWIGREDADSRELILYTPEPLSFLDTVSADRRVHQVVAGTGRGTWWEQTRLRSAVRANPPDVFFAGAYTAPLALGVPLAVTIHDVSFAAHPEWFTPSEGARRRLLTRQAARTACVIFTDSEFSRREILERLGASPDRLRVIPPGVTRRAEGATSRDPLVLFVGSIFNRRRLPATMAAFGVAAGAVPGARLVIAGSDRSYPPVDFARLAAETGIGGQIELRSFVSEAELDALYAQASVFVFLSEYEGFGLTPLEALSAGVPVVVLDTPVAREVYGEAAWYVSPDDDVRDAAAAMRTLLQHPAIGRQLLAHAPDVLARYSWDRAAAETLAAIEQVAARP